MDFIQRILNWLGLLPNQIVSGQPTPVDGEDQVLDIAMLTDATDPVADSPPIPYDDQLLERAKTQWQFGDWESLLSLDESRIEHNPERGKLALLIACAWNQGNDHAKARHYIKLAKQWGCDKRLIAQLLVAGVYNTLGRVAAANGEESRALSHFKSAVSGVSGDIKLLSQARAQREFEHVRHSEKLLREESGYSNQYDFQAANELIQAGAVIKYQNTEEGIEEDKWQGIVSYAQNFEDVMLWRALHDVKDGFYIDIGANHPTIDSVSRAFYDRGWRGINIEPVSMYAELLRNNRPEDIVLEVAISDVKGQIKIYEIQNTGISTGIPNIAERHRKKGYSYNELTVDSWVLEEVFQLVAGKQVHWLKIDVEGMEANVIRGWGQSLVRPWIVIVESTLPLTQVEVYSLWENLLLQKGYKYVYFDGLNRFYVSPEHLELEAFFKVGPNIFDQFTKPSA